MENKKYSRVYNYKYGGSVHKFRYNYETHELEMVFKPGENFLKGMREEPDFWKEGLGQVDETGYVVSTHELLRESNWKEDKYLWMDRMSEDCACLMNM